MDDVRTLLAAKLAEIDAQMTTMAAPPAEQSNISFGKRVGDGTQMAVDRLAQVGVHEKLRITRADVVRALAKLDEGTLRRVRRLREADPRRAARGAPLGRAVRRGRRARPAVVARPV